MASIESHLEVTEFLYVEPGTGMVTVMIADDEGFRPALAHEISGEILNHIEAFGYRCDQVMQKQGASLTEWAHAQVDAFCAEFEHAFCLDQPEVEGWDDVELESPAP